MTTKKLMVASIYCGGRRIEAPNRTWYEIQQRFLAKNTRTAYEHIVAINGSENANQYANSTVIAKIQDVAPSAYVVLMNDIITHYVSNQYTSLLILDSDAFPITEGWDELLDNELSKWGKTYASPMRVENLDTFPHLCALYAKNTKGFDIKGAEYLNLYGKQVGEVGVAMPREKWLPLLRSNVWNPHPIVAGVYDHLFFHFGAGSRTPVFRAEDSVRYKQRVVRTPESLQEELFADPEKFIQCLTGGRS